MIGSIFLLISINSIGICLGNGGELQPLYGQQKSSYVPPGYKNLPYICTLPPEAGPCDAAIPRYAYNASSGQCELFSYGGCEGNPNNFETMTECQQCCPAITSKSCPKVNITVCERPVNSVTEKCLGGGQFDDCGTYCPLICGKNTRVPCIDSCKVGCLCPTGYFRRIQDCQCVKKECCFYVGLNKIFASGQYYLCPPKYS